MNEDSDAEPRGGSPAAMGARKDLWTKENIITSRRTLFLIFLSMMILWLSYDFELVTMDKLQNALGIFSAIAFVWFLVSVTMTRDDFKAQKSGKLKLLPTLQAMVILEFLALGLLLMFFLSLLIVEPASDAINAPIGIVRDIKGNSTEWVLNLGGFSNDGDYENGLQIPLFVLILGAIGAYVNFLTKMASFTKTDEEYDKSKRKREAAERTQHGLGPNDPLGDLKNCEEIMEKIKEEADIDARQQKQRDAVETMGEFFLAPLLALGVYLLLVQGGTTSSLTIGVAALGVGLTVPQIVKLFEKTVIEGVLGKSRENGGTPAPSVPTSQ